MFIMMMMKMFMKIQLLILNLY